MSESTDMTSIATALASIVVPAGLPPIRRIYTGITEKAPTTAETPCIIIFRRKPSRVSFMTFGNALLTTEYVCQFILTPDGQGTIHDNYQQAIQYTDAIEDALYAHSQLYNAAIGGVRWSLPTVEGNVGTLKEHWNGQAYFGCDILVNVTASRGVTLGV